MYTTLSCPLSEDCVDRAVKDGLVLDAYRQAREEDCNRAFEVALFNNGAERFVTAPSSLAAEWYSASQIGNLSFACSVANQNIRTFFRHLHALNRFAQCFSVRVISKAPLSLWPRENGGVARFVFQSLGSRCGMEAPGLDCLDPRVYSWTLTTQHVFTAAQRLRLLPPASYPVSCALL